MILTEAQTLVRDTAREFARNRLSPHTREWEAAGEFPRDVLREMGQLGFLGMTVPEALGGAGLDYVSYALALMEVAAGDGALSTLMSVNNAPVCAILDRAGLALAAGALSAAAGGGRNDRRVRTHGTAGGLRRREPAHRGQARRRRLRAQRHQAVHHVGRHGRRRGHLCGDRSDGRQARHERVPGADRRPGLSRGPARVKLGQRASDTAQLVYEDVFVEERLRIGDEGEGYRIALANLETGRIGIGAQSVGMAAAALEHAVDYARDRTAFGKPLTQHQAVAFRLADMATDVEASRQLVLHAAALKDAGQPCLKEACMAKLFASERAERVASAAVQVLGGYGYVEDYLVEKIYRDVRVCQIYEGTSDIQRLLIGRELAS